MKKVGRRYKAGQILEYDAAYNYQRKESHVLNAGNRSVYSMFNYSDEQSLKNTLHEYLGDEDGKIQRNGHLRIFAKLPGLNNDLKAVEKEFRQYQQRKVQEGFVKPKEMPKDMLREKYKIEAFIDVAEAEVEWLKKHIEEYKEQREEEEERKVLYHGPICSSAGSPIREIDGQTVGSIVKNGQRVFIIKDKLSPYNRMAVSDYRKMGMQWRKERKKAGYRFTSRIKNQDLPPWPKGVERY